MNGEIKYFSMFTGVGGFELGLQNAGLIQQEGKGGMSNANRTASQHYSCVGFSEIDKYANQLLAKRFPNTTNFGDATKINPSELPDFDMLCGGFPCQSFSIAGKRKGFEDTRGTMFFHIARILEVKKPRLVFLENVKGLLNHNKGETFKVIIQTLSELGYDVQWMVLNSKFFGVPQNRERVFIIGSLGGKSRPEILPFKRSCPQTNETMLECKGYLNTHEWEKRFENIRRVYGTEGNAPTIPTGVGGGVMTKIMTTQSNIRRLTPIECERLQGFPDGWTEGFSDTQRYKMMGNAVTINVIKAIANKLKDLEAKK